MEKINLKNRFLINLFYFLMEKLFLKLILILWFSGKYAWMQISPYAHCVPVSQCNECRESQKQINPIQTTANGLIMRVILCKPCLIGNSSMSQTISHFFGTIGEKMDHTSKFGKNFFKKIF
jgi:hypothetical protein